MTGAPASATLQLAPHVRACRCDDQVILFDLSNGKYIGVGGKGAIALSRAVDGWPAFPLGASRSEDSVDIRNLAAPLVRQGLLTQPSSTSPLRSLPCRASAALAGEDWLDTAPTGPKRIARFLVSAARATLALRLRSLQAIATRVTAHRTWLEQTSDAVSPDSLHSALGAYQKLRPLVFSAHERCLHDSLALIYFLAGEGIGATWVLGVKTGPFAAHAWVQRGELVLNDEPDRVRAFTPILAA